MSLENKIEKEIKEDIKYIIEAPTRMYEEREIYRNEYLMGECGCGCPCPCIGPPGAIVKAATVMVMSAVATSVI